jgi:hypothetical protein
MIMTKYKRARTAPKTNHRNNTPTNRQSRMQRTEARRTGLHTIARAFDPVAYAAALEVLG